MSEKTDQLIQLLAEQQKLQADQLEEFRRQQADTNSKIVELLNAGKSVPISSSLPTFPGFDPTCELLSDYMSRFKTYADAHSLHESKQAGIFLTNQSPSLYKQLSNLAAQLSTPKQINELTLDEIEKFLREQYDPAQFIVRERHKFWSDMSRKPGEAINELAARIRQDASTCDFTEITDPLDEAMRTRFMCSVNNEAVLKALFKVKPAELTFAKAVETALETEEASKVAKETVHGSTPLVNQVQGTNPSHNPKTPKSNQGNKHRNRQGYGKKDQGKQGTPCFRCDYTNHGPDDCKFKDVNCNYCNIKGHIERACRKKKKEQSACKIITSKQTGKVRRVDSMHQLRQAIIINGQAIPLELDTGACDNFITDKVWQKLGRPVLQPSTTRYESATQDEINVLGRCQIRSKLPNERGKGTPINYVVSTVPNLNLLGRAAIFTLGISIDEALRNTAGTPRVLTVGVDVPDTKLQDGCRKLCQEFPDVFKDELGCLKGYELEVNFKPDTQPVFTQPRPVPFALNDDLNQALDVGIAKGIWKPVRFNDYGTPIVPVRKPGGKIRVCGDYSKTVNTQLETHRQPIPLPEDLFRKLAGGHGYTKIDLADAYNQIPLGPESQKKLALSTQRGVLLQMRLPFGITSAPGYFQGIMNQLTSDLPGVAVYLDDILVSGANAEDHLKNLRNLLKRLDEHNLRCRLEKCQFAQPTVEYLGHKLTAHGLEKGVKADAVAQMPAPKDESGLKSFLGSVQFYHKFLPNLSDTTEPLNKLLRKGEKWYWGENQQINFDKLKNYLTEDTVLAHFNPDLPIGIACDASNTGIGAVLFHRYPDGSERPIENVSKTLNDTQRKYGQVQKEALSIVYGLKKFYQYLYGRRFILVTDHKPLLAMFGPKKGVPTLAANRLSRWALLLSQYEYTVEYRPTNKHGNADALSRLPLGPDDKFDYGEDSDDVDTVLAIRTIGEQIEKDASTLAKETSKDPILSQVMRYTTEGWPVKDLRKEGNGELLECFRQIADSLSVVDNCLLNGTRVVIPTCLQRDTLQLLHMGHFGMQRMKQLARSAVYWPRIDKDIEETCRQCTDCAENQRNPPKYPVHPWMLPEKPWSRLHIDHAVGFKGSNWLVLVDAYSKYPCITRTNSTSTKATTDILEETFAHFGYPHTIVSDNATTFTSGEFKEWCKQRGIVHLTGAPYHPATNGAAERLVQSFKNSLNKSRDSPKQALQAFLMQYRRTPLSTGFSPSQLLNGRQIRCMIDMLLPSPAALAQKAQMDTNKSKPAAQPISKVVSYEVGTPVWALYYGPKRNDMPRWVPAVVTKMSGPRNLSVRVVPKGPVWRRHVEQLRPRHTSPEDDEPAETILPSTEDTNKTEPEHSATPAPPPRRYNPRWPTGGIDRDNPRRSERLKAK